MQDKRKIKKNPRQRCSKAFLREQKLQRKIKSLLPPHNRQHVSKTMAHSKPLPHQPARPPVTLDPTSAIHIRPTPSHYPSLKYSSVLLFLLLLLSKKTDAFESNVLLIAHNALSNPNITAQWESYEFGFRRIKIPLSNTTKNRDENLKGIHALHVNVWGTSVNPEENSKICPTDLSPHDHPHDFDSIILRGGYTHAWYQESIPPTGTPYSHHISKGNVSQNATQRAYLTSLKTESVQAGNIIKYVCSDIHRVICYTLNTITLHAVYRDGDKVKNNYFLGTTYKPKNRTLLTPAQSLIITTMVLAALNETIQSIIQCHTNRSITAPAFQSLSYS